MHLIVRGQAAYFLFNLRENLAVTTYFSVKTFISLVSSSRLDEKISICVRKENLGYLTCPSPLHYFDKVHSLIEYFE